MEDEKPQGVSAKLDKLIEVLTVKEEKAQEEKNKKPGIWIPWSAKVGKRKARQNYIIIDRWHSNMTRTYERSQIKDGTVLVDGIPRIVTPGDIMLYKGKKPMITIADWSTVPISPVNHFDESMKNGYGTKGWKLIYQRMKTSMIEDKKKISGMTIGIILIALAALGYFAFKGGLF